MKKYRPSCPNIVPKKRDILLNELRTYFIENNYNVGTYIKLYNDIVKIIKKYIK